MGCFDSLFGDDTEETAEQRKPRDPIGRLPPEPEFDAFRSAWKAGSSLFELFGDKPVKLKQPVGPEASNRRSDIAKVETFLGPTGHLDLTKTDGPTGYYGSRVDQGIRAFPRDNALRIDGLINPDGPTLQRIGESLSEDLGLSARSPQAADVAHIFVPHGKDGTSIDLDNLAQNRPSLIERVSDWVSRRTSATQPDERSAPREFSASAPGLASTSGPDSTAATPPSSARVEPASQNNGSGRSAALPAQAQADRTGAAWFEGGPIPDSVTHDDPVSAEKYMRGKVERWRREGLNDAADNLQRYLDGTGGIVPLSRDEVRKFEHVRDGEEDNTRRFLERTFLAVGTKSESALKLLDMKDGDRLDFRDDWDHKFTKSQAVQDYLLGDANFALAFGENNVKSTGEFSARRDGDTITIDGAIRHVWKEPYNFERGQPGVGDVPLRVEICSAGVTG